MKVRSALLLAAITASTLGAVIPGRAADPRICTLATLAPNRAITKVPGASGSIIYVDDRQKTAAPDSGLTDGGNGTWGFLESNNKPGLQTGGLQVVFDAADDTEDADLIGEHDKQYCNENNTVYTTGASDTIIF